MEENPPSERSGHLGNAHQLKRSGLDPAAWVSLWDASEFKPIGKTSVFDRLAQVV